MGTREALDGWLASTEWVNNRTDPYEEGGSYDPQVGEDAMRSRPGRDHLPVRSPSGSVPVADTAARSARSWPPGLAEAAEAAAAGLAEAAEAAAAGLAEAAEAAAAAYRVTFENLVAMIDAYGRGSTSGGRPA